MATVGGACLLLALTGGPIKGFGLELPGVTGAVSRAAIGCLAVLLVAASAILWRLQHGKDAEAVTQEQTAQAVPVSARPRLTPRFTGRGRALAEIRKQLRSGRVTVLAGMAGVGKTQLALAYLARQGKDYSLPWWINAEQHASLSADFIALADRLQLPERSHPDQGHIRNAVRQWLDDNTGWMLVFDNAEEPEALEGYLPSDAAGGHVLITSRNPQWRDAAVIKVAPWTREESLQFLRQSQSADAGASNELAELLGDLPLALEQALAYMDETTTSPDRYVQILRERGGEVFAFGTPSSYEERVATTWSVSLEEIRAEMPAAQDLLFVCAFLAPDAIPRELLLEHARMLPRSLRLIGDPIAHNEAIRVLGRYSLVSATTDLLSIHRVLQTVIRHRLKLNTQEQHRWAETAVKLLDAAFPKRSDDVFAWRACQRLLPHALAAANHSIGLGVAPATSVELLNRAALYLWARAELGEAIELLESTLAVIEDRLGPDHLAAATNQSTRGKVLRELGELDAAKRAHERALEIRQARRRSNHPDLAWSLGNLGKVLRELRELDAARRSHEQAVRILESAFGPNHPDVAWSLGNLGRTLQDLGDVTAAYAIHERALRIREATLPSGHPDIAWSLRNLGDTLEDLGRPAEARSRYERALSIFQARFAHEHPEVITTKRRLEALVQADDAPEHEFEHLFDGIDLGLWKMAGPGRFVMVGEGVLETESGMGLLWYAKQRFSDFILKLEWMATGPDDNSGVFVRFPDPGNDPWIAVDHGYEIQIDDRPSSKYQTGAIYGFAPPSEGASKPVGSWNEYEIAVVGQRYTVVLNGKKVNQFTGDRGTVGYVGLQNHDDGSRVRFRNIRLRTLSPTRE
jgi:tetratricopeptide (TPR) repeat protein